MAEKKQQMDKIAEKTKKKQKKLQAKQMKAEQKAKKKQAQLQRKAAKKEARDPVKRAQAKAAAQVKKVQKKQKAATQRANAQLKKQKQKAAKAAKRQQEKAKRQDPQWQAKQQQIKAEKKQKQLLQKQSAKQKKLVQKERDQQKKQMQKLRKKEQAEKAKLLKQDPAWRAQEKERKAQARIAAKEKKQRQKVANVQKKLKEKERKALAKQQKLQTKQAKPPMAKRKKILLFFLIFWVLGVGIGSGAYILFHPSPQTVTERYLTAFIEQDEETMVKYAQASYQPISQKICEDERYQPIEDMLRARVYDVTFVLGEANIEGDTATVAADFTVYDLQNAMHKGLENYKKENYVKYVSGKYDENFFEEAIVECLSKELSLTAKSHEESIIIYLTKIDGQWRLDNLYEKNALLGKMLSGCLLGQEEV